MMSLHQNDLLISEILADLYATEAELKVLVQKAEMSPDRVGWNSHNLSSVIMEIVQEARKLGKVTTLWRQIKTDFLGNSLELNNFLYGITSTIAADVHLSGEEISVNIRRDLHEILCDAGCDYSYEFWLDIVERTAQTLPAGVQGNCRNVLLPFVRNSRLLKLPLVRLLWVILENIWAYSVDYPTSPCFVREFINQFERQHAQCSVGRSRYQAEIAIWLTNNEVLLLNLEGKAADRPTVYDGPKSIYYAFQVIQDVESESRYYVASWVYQGNESDRKFDPEPDHVGNDAATQSADLDSVIRHFNERFAKFQSQFADQIEAADDLVIEFIVPWSLLDHDFCRWKQKHLNSKSEYGMDYTIIVRPDYRLTLPPWNRQGWRRRWEKIVDLLELSWKNSICWKSEPVQKRRNVDETELFVGFERPLVSGTYNLAHRFSAYFEEGVPIMIWCNKEMLEFNWDFKREVATMLEETELKLLPSKLRDLRKDKSDSIAFNTVLLWDNPYRSLPSQDSRLYDDPK